MTAIGPGPHTGSIVALGVTSIDEAVALAAGQVRSFLSDREFTFTTEAEPVSINAGDGTSRIVGWDVTVRWEATP